MRKRSVALNAALVGVMAATLECAKLALSAIPNVEVVTLLIALYSTVFGWLGVASAVIFVAIEPLIWGFGSWVISYLLYWPLVAIVFLLLKKVGIKNRWALTGIAVLLTFFFGVLTSLVDIGLFSGTYDEFFKRFFIYYSRGVYFYLIQIASNAILFPYVFQYLMEKLTLVKNKIIRE